MEVQADYCVSYKDFVEVVAVLDKKVEELENLSRAWRLIAESLMGVQKEY